jgi:hypothetical protein
MTTRGQIQLALAAAGLFCLTGAGCHRPMPPGTLVLAQAPATPAATTASDELDLEYPAGSRIVLLAAPFDPRRVRVLTRGLAAAGDPVVSYDGRSLLFTGKGKAADDWQIYAVGLASGGLRKLTAMHGGAMSPALLPDGSLIFVSPVPKSGRQGLPDPPTALFVQSEGGRPHQLTFGPGSIADPTVLSDGRILFVSTQPPATTKLPPGGPALFTINNDGTELSAFSGRLDSGARIERPRQLPDGRIAYVISARNSHSRGGVAEAVRMARPYLSRAPLLSDPPRRVCSVQPAANGDLLVCAETGAGAEPSSSVRTLFRLDPAATSLGAPLCFDPAWHICSVVEPAPRPPPSGRISSTDPTKRTGHLLCLDANYTGDVSPSGATEPAARVRLFAELTPGEPQLLGELPVQSDGSFMVEAPADVPLGFETLDASGRVLRREAPMTWVRPGENRSCVGCHEPPNRAPRNHRPLALSVAVPRLSLAPAPLASPQADR